MALLAAWALAALATVPFQAAMCLRNSDGDLRLFRQMMPLVLMIWCVWTLGLALAGWLFLALPIALIVKPQWIHRWSGWFIAACATLAIAATTVQFDVWKLVPLHAPPHAPIDKFSYVLYTVFATSYAVTMAAVYSWLAGRRSRQKFIDPAVRN